MTNPIVPGFPNAPQSEYARISKAPLPGSLWEEEHDNARPLNGLLAHVDEIAFIKPLTFGNNTPTDEIGLKIDGGLVSVPSGADATATALAWSNALKAAGFAWKVLIDESVPAAAVVTITGVVGKDPVLEVVAGGATTLVIGVTQAAVVQPIVCFGFGVVAAASGEGLNPNKFAAPSALTDKFMGVVLRTSGSQIPAGQLQEYDPTLDPNNLVPGFSYSVEREDVGVVVEYSGDAPDVLDPVYHVMTGVDAGKWAKSSGAGSKVVTLTATSVADGLIGFSYDGLPALSLTATAAAIADTTSLHGLFIANSLYLALVDGDAANAVDNLDGTMTITFTPGLDPTFADTSNGTSSMVEAIDTAVVAANAVARPEYSWGKKSIEASADIPARAFLRLSRS